jgi:hypothetical protein
MTVINCAAGAIYTRGFPAKEKIQLYGMALVFLALLYNSPAGLVLYWTLNNVFSLLKNIFYKLKNPLKIVYIVLSICTVVFIVYMIFVNTSELKKRLVLIGACSVILFIPFFIKGIRSILSTYLAALLTNHSQRTLLFIISCITMSILAGICIPSAVIASSPEEFCFIDQYQSPIPFIFSSFLPTAGLCIFWTACIYFLFNNKIKTILTAGLSLLVFTAMVNAFIFQGDYGAISNTFLFDTPAVLPPSKIAVVVNTAVFLSIIVIFLVLVKKQKTGVIISCMGIMLASLAVFSSINIRHAYSGYKKFLALRDDTAVHSISPVFSLSKENPNVIVFMADRAINGYVKPIFAEHPQLEKQFDGFTLYPNTVSFSKFTLMGVPPIWGGYEYTPMEINKRHTVPLVEKHNEALLVLPRIFAAAGYQVTVADPSWANHSWIPDISIYKPYADITALNTERKYTELWYRYNNTENTQITSAKIKRNAPWFSFLKIAPPLLRVFIYDEGLYWSPENIGDSLESFINYYAALDFLPELTDYAAKKPAALFLTNDVTHDSVYLQYPDYIPVEKVTDKGTGEFSEVKEYHVNNAFYLKFGEWLDELKRNNVYDNTRIIIVSDHGSSVDAKIAGAEVPFLGDRRERYNPVLLEKDFNARGELKTDMAFMTNADVPFLTTAGIIQNPANPFTGQPITSESKNNGVSITTNAVSMPYQHPKNIFDIKDGQWIFVHDNIFDANNWEKVNK